MLSPVNHAGSPWRRLADFEIPRTLRAAVRARESSLILLAAAIGMAGGLVAVAMSRAVTWLHWILFAVPPGERLSALTALDPRIAVAIPLVGGLVFGLATYVLARRRPAR